MKSLRGNPADWLRFVIRRLSARCAKGVCCIRGLRLANIGPTLLPKPERDWNRIDVQPPPPSKLVPGTMELAVVQAADRDDEFVAHAPSKCARLCECEVMGVGRKTATHQARLPEHEFSVVLVSEANHFAQAPDRAGAKHLLGARGQFRDGLREYGAVISDGMRHPGGCCSRFFRGRLRSLPIPYCG
jgi:hypothetical protein